MVNFKSLNNIVLDMLQQLRLTQPSLDTKPGAVARDLMVDLQAIQIADIYESLRELSNLQSILNISGQDLVNYAKNFGVTKNSGTKAIGTVVFTFSSIDSDITIPAGTTIRTRNGIPFLTVSDISISTSQINSLRANATRLRQELATASINDEYAIEASVEAQSAGSIGNISSYSVTTTNSTETNNVTNLVSFTGGTDPDSDSELRAKILSVFAGANVGTSVAYRSTILSLASAIDALVVEPGDPLMTRDGTIVYTDTDGNKIVSEPGSGGRVDIYVLGTNAQSGTDSFVYNDQSGQDDPTSTTNDYVLGQSSLTPDTSLTINSRRVSALSDGDEIPEQPISSIISVSGSLSGPNFVEQYLDTDGTLKGNYKLVKDDGVAGGSPFGLDKLRWTDSKIDLTEESNVKTGFNSVDGLGFTDVTKISNITQDIEVLNENPTIQTGGYIKTKHTPIRTVNRVFNQTTGERYTISDQTPDDTGDINTSGRIKISGRTLPTTSDILQVDYTWIYPYDSYIDFDTFNPKDELNTAQDSIDWGFPNYIRDEIKTVSIDAYGNKTITTDLNVSRVLSVNTYVEESATISSGNIIVVSNNVSNIHSIKSNGAEIYKTKANDGSTSNMSITLPSDTLGITGNTVTIIYNLTNVFVSDSYGSGEATNNIITLPTDANVVNGTNVRVNYVANFSTIISKTNISTLPISTNGLNGFDVDGYQPVQNEYSGASIISNKRRSPSRLRVTVGGLLTSGTIRFVGTTINKVSGTYTVTQNDTIDLSLLIRSAKGLSDTATLSNNITIARVLSLKSVSLNADGSISGTNTTYDLTNYSIYNNDWDKTYALENTSLGRREVSLSSVSTNTNNLISTGTILYVEFYYAEINDFENMFFSKSGTQITDKRFGKISSISRLSGFQNAQSTIIGNIIIKTINQPDINATFTTDYSYTAPKENERITINYEYNKLIVDATQAIEDIRPITADVLIKQAEEIEVDVTAYIVVEPSFSEKTETVKQDVADNISSSLNSEELGSTIDSSDIIDGIYNVAGVDRVRITRFNKTNVSGTKNSITAENNQYIAPGTITVYIEER